jgi:glycosyltransferase involved in cell wall biosynthesis
MFVQVKREVELTVRPPTIVLFIDSLVAAGAQRQIVLLAQQLKLSGYAPRVLVYHDTMDLKPMLDAYEIPVILLRRDDLGVVRMVIGMYRCLRQVQPIAIIGYLHGPSLMARILGRLAGIRVIITSERSISLHRSRLTFWSERLTRWMSTVIVTNTHAGRDVLIQAAGVPSDKIVAIYNGIDISVYRRGTSQQRLRVREKYGVDQAAFVVVLPGRVVAEKNHECLIRAVGRVKFDRPFFVLLVGQEIDIPLRDRVRALALSLGVLEHVIFTGPATDMAEVYAGADVIVLPSLSEALPNVVIEAMACEKVVIASRIADNASLIEHGVSGLLFPSDDDAALAAALETCMSQDQESAGRMGAAARMRISTLCSTERFRIEYVALIERFCGPLGSVKVAS